ncbi:hypothetical protein OG21DRAFT_1507558 [Imleria badia]|nr:hypothetical protein OG21DRAFT_1507558 [Imleria badia]
MESLYLPLFASCRVIAMMLDGFLFQQTSYLIVINWSQWRTLHLSVVQILHSQNLAKTPPGFSRSNADSEVFCLLGK